jgi:hypothetical protein
VARRRRWIPILIVLTLLGSAPAFVGVAWRRAHRKVRSLLQVPEDLAMKIWLAEYRRPSLFGDPLPGNAWDHYGRVNREIMSSEDRYDELLAIRNSAYPVRFPPDIARFPVDHRAWVDELFLGLRSDTLRRTWTDPTVAHLPALEAFLIVCAEAERQAGHDTEALRLLCGALTVSGDFRRGVFPSQVGQDLDGERYVAVIWRLVLQGHGLAPAELQSVCALLDRIEEIRPTLFDAIRNHHEDRRARKVSAYVANPKSLPPGWRELWNPTIRACELADDLDRSTRAILALEGRPPWEREGVVEEVQNVITEQDQVWVEAHTLPAQAKDFHWEAVGRGMRDLIRVATALARYEAEKGRMPERLADLVPRYLPRPPVCAASGSPFPYEGGVLTTPPEIQSGFSREAGGVDWPIRRR